MGGTTLPITRLFKGLQLLVKAFLNQSHKSAEEFLFALQ